MEISDMAAMDGAPLAAQQQEKMVPQSRVNEIVAREKAQMAERTRQMMMEEFGQRQAQVGQSGNAMGGMPGLDIDQIRRQVHQDVMREMQESQIKRDQELADKAAREKYEAEMKNVVENYHRKVSTGKDSYEDFEKVVGDVDISEFPRVAILASQLDNTADVMYDLAKNPLKMAQLDVLAERSPNQAMKMLKSLADSIQQNRTAMQQRGITQAPLSRMKSSAGAGTGSGEMSLADFKRADYNL